RHDAVAGAGAVARPAGKAIASRRPHRQRHGRAAGERRHARRATVDPGRSAGHGARPDTALGHRQRVRRGGGWRGRWWWRRWWGRRRPAAAAREGEVPDPRAPVEARRRRVVLLRVPEGAVVHGVDRQVAVVAPAVARPALAARPREKRRLTLRERV